MLPDLKALQANIDLTHELGFIKANAGPVTVDSWPLRPTTLADLRDNVFLQHDLNIYNFVIQLNASLRAQGRDLALAERPDFSMISSGDFALAPLPRGRLNFVDVQTAIAEAHGLRNPRPYLAGRRGLLLRVNELEKANAEHGALIERLRLERDSLVGGRERLNASAGLVVPEPRRSLPLAGLVRRLGVIVDSLGHSTT